MKKLIINIAAVVLVLGAWPLSAQSYKLDLTKLDPTKEYPTWDYVIAYEKIYILYWDSATNTMQLGSWGTVTQENILFSKFGSVVGFTTTSNDDTWDAGDVKFNPTNMSYENYSTIPSWNGGNKEDGYISSSAYHTLENVRAGLGDICKLAGLTKSDIDNGIIDNKRFRLPTDSEIRSHYIDVRTRFIGDLGDLGYGLLHGPEESSFLPAAGGRYNVGLPNNVHYFGYYWTGSPYDDASGWGMLFNEFVVPRTAFNAGSGNAIRCVFRLQ